MTETPTRSITVRLDADLLQAIREAAAKNGQSMNAEIASRLRGSVEGTEVHPVFIPVYDPWPAFPTTESDIIDWIESLKKNIKSLNDQIEVVCNSSKIEYNEEQLRGIVSVLSEMHRQNLMGQIQNFENEITNLQLKLNWIRKENPKS